MAVFILWSALVDKGILRPMDLVFARIFYNRMPDFLAWFFGLVCRTGNVEFSLPLWAGLIFLIFRKKIPDLPGKILPSIFLTGFFLGGSLLEHLMKRVLFQPLPFLSRDPLDAYLHPILSIKTPFSYPSGHTLRAFMLLSLISLWLHGQRDARQRLLLFAVWASIIAVGVNAIGWHWTSDVIGSLLFAGGAHFLSRAVYRQ